MPMDLSAVEALCDAALPSMAHSLDVRDVRITLVYAPLDDDEIGQCETDAPYRRATITIDPAGHDSDHEVLDTLRHEVVHVVISEFEVYSNVVEANILETDEAAAAVAKRAWRLANERTVNRLEKVLDRLGWTPEALAGRDTTCAACGKTWRASAPEGTERVECPKCGEYVTLGRVAGVKVDPPFRLIQFEKGARHVLFDCRSARVLGTSGHHFGHVPVRIEDPDSEQPEPLGCGLVQVENPLGGWTLLETAGGAVLGNGEGRFAGVDVRD